jgi:hypothetical protein
VLGFENEMEADRFGLKLAFGAKHHNKA